LGGLTIFGQTKTGLEWATRQIPTLNVAKDAKFRMGHPGRDAKFETEVHTVQRSFENLPGE